ncbi:hypothetical protein B566_EDAN002073 [Ephemera danica]|nr:hypothetical protein B566_EDAN002073 [Ephemera danica]
MRVKMSFNVGFIFVLCFCSTINACNAAAIQQSMESLLSRLSNISDVSTSCASSSTQLSIDLIGLMRLVASDMQKSSTSNEPPASKVRATPAQFPATSLNLVELGGRNYFFSQQQDTTFFDALVFCNAYGMDLATIETAEENRLLINHLTSLGVNTAFISGHKIGRGTFAWSNGTPINFSYWDAGEPDAPEAQHCIVLHNKKWHNAGCLTPYKFVCEQR